MKKAILLLLICLANSQAFSQENDLAMASIKNDKSIRTVRMDSTADVANWVLSKYNTEIEIVRSIYSWVTGNIQYDKTGAFAMNAGLDKEAKIHVAFSKRKGVCENFAAIFNDICKRSGLVSFTIEGYTRLNGFVQKGSHSWVTVKINNEWYFFDPTWDVGGRLQYFMQTPEEFIDTHIPFDPLWQFLSQTAGFHEFTKGEISVKNTTPALNYKDSLVAYLAMDSLKQWESAERRILQSGATNSQAQINLKKVKMNLEIERQGEQVIWYNEAIDNLNQSIEILNHFIAYRNDLFIPHKTDRQLAEILVEPEMKIARALDLLDKTDHSKATLVMGTWQVRERIASFEKRLKIQKDFLNRYLLSPVEKRDSLFYK